MRSRYFFRGLLFLLFFSITACELGGNRRYPTETSLPSTADTATEIRPTSTTIATATSEPERPAGEIAYEHVQAISEGIGSRVAGSEGETKAAQYIVMEFERLGYISELRPFSFTARGKTINSANVIAYKPGASEQQIIVGAHYDSVAVGKGADDNASGIAVILEVAERIRATETPYTIRFVLFGAEEFELQGSTYYVGQMKPEEIQNTIAMINLDSLAAGDIAYIYGDAGKQGVIRDWALDHAARNNLTLQTQPGENPKYPAGTTGDWSDHAPFKSAGIPYAYFESTNWALGEKDGYTQVGTEYGEGGEIWHTKYDTLEYINKTFPGRVQQRLRLYVTLLEAILTEFQS